MDLYLFRHGEAEPRGPAVEEARRALTDKGRRDVSRVAERARKAKVQPSIIVTSPYTRARQTAEIAAKSLPAEIVESRHLRPSGDPAKLWLELAPHAGKAVLLAGHEPHMSKLVQYLLCADLKIDFKKGALVRIMASDPPSEPKGIFKWMITPRLSG
jgi:phosphohistidine phosphatase